MEQRGKASLQSDVFGPKRTLNLFEESQANQGQGQTGLLWLLSPGDGVVLQAS